MIFKENYKLCLFKTLFIYSIYILFELIFSIFVINLSYINYNELFSNKNICLLFSTIILISTLAFFGIILKIKKFKEFWNKQNSEKVIDLMIILFFFFIIMLNNKNIMSFNIEDYIIDITLVTILLIIIFIIIFQSKKINEAHKKNDIFLEFLKNYEIKADKDSEFKHEILNYLIILKSAKLKKQKDQIIDDLLIKYDNKAMKSYRNISKLPSGIKGIIYYKVSEMQNLNIQVDLNISTKIDKLFNEKSIIEYKDIGEILTILLDNAIEAIKTIKNKNIVINLYVEKNQIIIEVNNPCKKNININKLAKLGYSTKGKNRGLGLYIAKNIIKANKNFDFKQYIESQRFYSVLIIK
ncbi:MAG: GHKL domain-containing protein [Bacilli bacterium]